jgi:surface protein
MFQGCKELEYLDLSNFNTINVTDMGWMFCNCHKLKEIKGINNFITINTINMRGIFAGCNELVYLKILKKWLECSNNVIV